MARISVSGIDDLISSLDSLQFDEIAPQMLQAAEDDVIDAMKRSASAHVVSGSLEDGIKAEDIKHTGNAYEVMVATSGKDPEGVDNMQKANYMEYGNSHQTATPIIAPAIAECEGQAISKMTKKFNELIKGLEI